VIAYTCCGVGGIGMCYLWLRWSHNYVWVLNSIFIPGLLSGLSGIVSTFAGIYSQPNHIYNRKTIVAIAVTGGCTVICGFLTAIYALWKIRRVKRLHSREMEQAGNVDEPEVLGVRHLI